MESGKIKLWVREKAEEEGGGEARGPRRRRWQENRLKPPAPKTPLRGPSPREKQSRASPPFCTDPSRLTVQEKYSR